MIAMKTLLTSFLLILFSNTATVQQPEPVYRGMIDPTGTTIESRFQTPPGYERISDEEGSFARWLRDLPLKAHGSTVKYYNGSTKSSRGVYAAVIDKAIGSGDLHQCADAVIRLRAEYLWETEQYDRLHFKLTNGWNMEYTEWMKGKRFKIKGNTTWWENGTARANTYEDLWGYLTVLFNYAGTYSLNKELKAIDTQEMQIGDMFIRGGFPGHVMIIVDMAVNPQTGQKVFMLAQSYMPAQELQVVINPNNSSLGVWYPADFGETLYTPEWTFKRSEFKRFEN